MNIIFIDDVPEIGDDWVELTPQELEDFGFKETRFLMVSKKRGEPDWLIQNTGIDVKGVALNDCYVPEFKEFCQKFDMKVLFSVFYTYDEELRESILSNIKRFETVCNLKRIDEEDD